MSSKDTIFLTNDLGEEAFFDSNEYYKDKNGEIKDSITIELNKENIRIDDDGISWLVFTITNVDSDLYKIFSKLGAIVPKENK